ncbi:hypothetical protein ACFS6H_00840 [Terrimonas rubra]|uniref:Uncharacterized protein n=1 Tax=Terrimonas rubra TaxID=1035890 RepID=A0ABW6A207_9BACT
MAFVVSLTASSGNAIELIDEDTGNYRRLAVNTVHRVQVYKCATQLWLIVVMLPASLLY